ncbi:hypothetical protein [Cypionkella sp.]|jgi:hypothetical protein|uniref:hypothetical protein n=1 Tax=Cypionkella sp. TaxID=2811411 RepID=UPI00271EA149|nr:hypothetical protein [Cypionkella sp.]MDO8983748.1 hypothetical protein [Cypionkella sp.]MDP2051475.1 hypothetical protein [Cypionkella sp.]
MLGQLADRAWGSFDQAAGIGIARPGEYLLHRTALDLTTLAHDDNMIGDLGHHAHVMGDEQNCGSRLALQIL